MSERRPILLALAALLPMMMGASIYPPMVGGQFEFKVLPVVDFDAGGIALEPPPNSIGIVPEGGGAAIACVATPDPARSCDPDVTPCAAEPYTVTASVGTAGVRQDFRAVAFLTGDCSATTDMPASGPSVNIAHTYPGMSPRPPELN